MTQGHVERCYGIVGANIRVARRAQRFTQDDLAVVLRCARNTVARIETGQERFMLHMIPRVARWLRCTPQSLMKGVWS